MASLVTKFFTTHVGKDVGNAQGKAGGLPVLFIESYIMAISIALPT
jgi:hypothetical protein